MSCKGNTRKGTTIVTAGRRVDSQSNTQSGTNSDSVRRLEQKRRGHALENIGLIPRKMPVHSRASSENRFCLLQNVLLLSRYIIVGIAETGSLLVDRKSVV